MKMMEEVTASMKRIQVKVDSLDQWLNRQQSAPVVTTQAPAVYASRPSSTTAGGTLAAS